MSDLKITELTANTTPIGTDLLAMVDDPAGTPATQKITLANLGLTDGWMPASETWTYASASTITVPSGAGSKYSKGDKIKLTQTTVKYFYVIAVADTVLTVTGGSDYTVANASITNNFYSKKENPQDFPSSFAYSPTLAGYSANPTTVRYSFYIKGRVCNVMIAEDVAGTSNSTATTYTLPVNSANISGGKWSAPGYGVDNGSLSANPVLGVIALNSGTLTVFLNYAVGNWTASGGKRVIALQISYEI